MIGIGAYQGATRQSVMPAITAVKLWLCHLCPSVAIAVRAANPHALIGLRADLGDDARQVNFQGIPAVEATSFFNNRIMPAFNAVPDGTYSFVVGINEAWPDKADKKALQWRAVFELALCNLVQKDLKLPYAWGAIPVGNLEPEDVAIFAEVFRSAWAVNYHGYLAPDHTSLSQEDEPYYLLRPIDLWIPELKKLHIKLRVLLGECGTFAAPSTYSAFSKDAEATLVTSITEFYSAATIHKSFEFIGACAFGVGTLGDQAGWDLASSIGILADAARNDPQPPSIILPGGNGMPEPNDFPSVVWEPSPNFGYPTRGTHGRRDPITGNTHRVVALVMHIEQGTEIQTDYTFDNADSQVSATVSNPRAAGAALRQHVHDDDAPWANGIDTSLGVSYYGSDVSLAWLMDCYRSGSSVNIVTRSMEHEGLSGQNLTPEQYARTLAWCLWQFRKEGWKSSEVSWRIVGHYQINKRDKAGCPGPGFPFKRLRDDVAASLTAAPPAFDVGPLASYLLAHPDLGAPRMNAWTDAYQDVYVYVAPTPQHPKGPLVIWRHSTGEIDVAFA